MVSNIKSRILLFMAMASVGTAVIMSAWFYTYTYEARTEALAKEGQAALQALAQRALLAEAMSAKLPPRHEIQSLAPSRLFDRVQIYIDDLSKPKADLNYADGPTLPADRAQAAAGTDGYFTQGDRLYLVQPIGSSNVHMGSIVASMPLQPVQQEMRWLALWLMLACVLVLGVVVLVARRLHRLVVAPVNRLALVAERITTQQDYSLRMEEEADAELGGLYHNFNEMLDQIGAQNQAIQELNSQLEQKIEARVHDLTQAQKESERLLQDTLHSKTKAEELAKALARRQEYEKRVMAFNEAMQSKSSENIESWGEHILKLMVDELSAVQGALYIASYQADHEIRLRLISTYAYDIKTILRKTVKSGDGVMGQVLKTQQITLLDNLPADYMKVVSALGESSPNSALIIPLMADEQVQGIIEIGSFQRITAEHLDFVQQVSRSVAYTLLVIKNKDDIQRLLEEARMKNEQLEVREEELEKSEERLRLLNESLEQQVQKRTEALTHTLEDLKSTQAQLVQSEKMASLGQLIAGIAHEINTPIGAIKASAGNLHDSLPLLLIKLPVLTRELTTAQYDLFARLGAQLLAAKKNLSSREERQARKTLSEQLAANGCSMAEDLARTLIEVGLSKNLEPYYELFRDGLAEKLNEVLYHLGQLKVNADNIENASERTKKIVFALKSYAYRQDNEDMVPINLAENLDMILTLYANQLKHGVDLVVDYGQNISRVMAFPDELSQVWTNIITNALQAINYQGRMEVRLAEADERVSVSIIDNGPGIPPDIQEKIFDPFFTTKRQGEGTGLGLDICRRIIEKHNGRILLTSEPGHTEFKILLPAAPED